MKLKTVFLIDGLGAVSTAVLLAILTRFNEYVGMPRVALAILSLVASIFAVYSLSCFVLLRAKPKGFLLPIMAGNLAYCILTLALCLYFRDSLTVLGAIYFLGEIAIILGLVLLEWTVLKRNR